MKLVALHRPALLPLAHFVLALLPGPAICLKISTCRQALICSRHSAARTFLALGAIDGDSTDAWWSARETADLYNIFRLWPSTLMYGWFVNYVWLQQL